MPALVHTTPGAVPRDHLLRLPQVEDAAAQPADLPRWWVQACAQASQGSDLPLLCVRIGRAVH